VERVKDGFAVLGVEHSGNEIYHRPRGRATSMRRILGRRRFAIQNKRQATYGYLRPCGAPERSFAFLITKRLDLRRFALATRNPQAIVCDGQLMKMTRREIVEAAASAGALALAGQVAEAQAQSPVALHWLGDEAPPLACGVTWGVPFARGEVSKSHSFAL